MTSDPMYRRYADLLARVILNLPYIDAEAVRPRDQPKLAKRSKQSLREHGQDWPTVAVTMAGLKRLDSLRECVDTVVSDAIPGDIIETGVWRGGSMIYARMLLDVLGEAARGVWLADSFAGLPAPDGRYAADAGNTLHARSDLAVSRAEVEGNFCRFGLDPTVGVRFLVGWFKDTLPLIDGGTRFAIIRLDGDMYGSTMDALQNLYPKLSPGGFCIIDDWGASSECRAAVKDYFGAESCTDIEAGMVFIDWTCVLWRKR